MGKSGLETVPAAVHLEDVAKSQTGQVLGSTGKTGDFLSHIVVVPETTGAGTIALLDGSVSRNIFIAGTLSNLQPFTIWFNARSVNGAWSLTTGDNVHAICVGSFT